MFLIEDPIDLASIDKNISSGKHLLLLFPVIFAV